MSDETPTSRRNGRIDHHQTNQPASQPARLGWFRPGSRGSPAHTFAHTPGLFLDRLPERGLDSIRRGLLHRGHDVRVRVESEPDRAVPERFGCDFRVYPAD